jgi:UDP:flavonoid glycosyltransferase YjiC (YdhE family)
LRPSGDGTHVHVSRLFRDLAFGRLTMRVLFATTGGAGHFSPLVPFARACMRAGHDVLVAGHESVAPLVERTRLPFRPLPEPDDEQVAAVSQRLRSLEPRARMEHALPDLYIRCYAVTALPGMVATIEDWPPDVIVREGGEFTSCVVAERIGVPQARVGIGLSAALENRALQLAAEALDELRDRAGIGPDPGAARVRESPVLTLAPRSLEDPSAPEPAALRRFRDPGEGAAGPLPHWWEDREEPLVYVSFGTEVSSPTRGYFPGFYRAVVDALSAVPARVLLTTGDRCDPAELGPLPPAVHVERWVPQAAVMPHAAAMVGHGGSGSTLMALAAGVPMALIPFFADQPYNARRVCEIGAGLTLTGGPAAAAGVGDAVTALLRDRSYADGAARVADEIRALAPVDDAVPALVEIVEAHEALTLRG